MAPLPEEPTVAAQLRRRASHRPLVDTEDCRKASVTRVALSGFLIEVIKDQRGDCTVNA
jgi:hypothetical protein